MTLAREIQNTRFHGQAASPPRRAGDPGGGGLRSLYPDRTRTESDSEDLLGSPRAGPIGRGRLEPAATTHSGVCCAAGRGLSGASGLLRPWQLAKRAYSDCLAFGRQVAAGPGRFKSRSGPGSGSCSGQELAGLGSGRAVSLRAGLGVVDGAMFLRRGTDLDPASESHGPARA